VSTVATVCDGSVATVCDGSVGTECDGSVGIKCDGSVSTMCDGSVSTMCDGFVNPARRIPPAGNLPITGPMPTGPEPTYSPTSNVEFTTDVIKKFEKRSQNGYNIYCTLITIM